MTVMRAKMHLESVQQFAGGSEKLFFKAVPKSGRYPEDGSDDDNTYSIFSPMASLEILVANPALQGKLKAGEKYYVDFTKAPD